MPTKIEKKVALTFAGLRRRVARSARAHRKALGLTQRQVAEAAEINLRTYQRLEAGEGNPTMERIALLAAALRIEPVVLVARPR